MYRSREFRDRIERKRAQPVPATSIRGASGGVARRIWAARDVYFVDDQPSRRGSSPLAHPAGLRATTTADADAIWVAELDRWGERRVLAIMSRVLPPEATSRS